MKKVIIDTLKKLKWFLLIIITFIFVNMYLDTYPSKIIGKIIDLFINIEQNKTEIEKNIIYLLLISFCMLLSRLPWRTLTKYATTSFEKNIKDKLFEQFLKIDMTSIQNIKNGELMSYFTQDLREIRVFFNGMLSFGTRVIAISIIVIYTMIKTINLKLTLISLIPIIITVFIMIKLKNILEINYKKTQKNFTKLSQFVQESTTATKTTKSYCSEKYQLENFIRRNQELKKSNISVEITAKLLNISVQICFGLCYAISLIYGSKLVLNGTISIGDFTAFNGYISLFVFPVEILPLIISRYKRAQVSYKRLDEFFSLPKEKILITENKNKVDLISGDIKIENLSYNYPTTIEVALQNINLTIKQNSTLGIIGTIGSGKTTLSNLLVKLYDVPYGKIKIGDKDINDIPISLLRKSFCYITQDNFLFSTSIKDNITLFNNEYNNSEIEDSVKSSMLYDEISDMKNGIDTIIGDNGEDLSGGQRQRVAISRAFVRRSNFIIFDDTFSALDNKTEQQVLENVKKLCKNKTCIIISNRISDVKDADNIIVLDNGEIIEQGTHTELLKNNKLYTKFYKQQTSKKNLAELIE